MKKFFAVCAAWATTQTMIPIAFAGLPDPYTSGLNQLPGNGTVAGIIGIVITVITIVLDVMVLLGVIFVIIAGIRLIASGGDEGEKDKAKKGVIYVIIGIVVVLFARVIVTFFATLV